MVMGRPSFAWRFPQLRAGNFVKNILYPFSDPENGRRRYSSLTPFLRMLLDTSQRGRGINAVRLFVVGVVVWLMIQLGILDHLLLERPYSEFHWPLDVDVVSEVRRMSHGHKPFSKPCNSWESQFVLLPKVCSGFIEKKDDQDHYPVFQLMIKSKDDHFIFRENIRKTWGKQHTLSLGNFGFSQRQWKIRTVFLVGTSTDDYVNNALKNENSRSHDILQGDFIDAYQNNTLKTMMGFRWLMTECGSFAFVLFVDDDFFVSPANAILMLQRLLPQESQQAGKAVSDVFVGYRFDSGPFRCRWHKHYTSLRLYPFHRYPPYIAAGAYVLSRESLSNLYFASHFVETLPWDDVFLGLVAKSVGLVPIHSDRFEFWKRWFGYGSEDFTYLVAAHGFQDLASLKEGFQHTDALYSSQL